MLKKSLIILTLLLSSILTHAQFGHTVLNADSVTVLRKLRISNIMQGDPRDSLIGHKRNGSTTRLHQNQIVIPYTNVQGRPTALSQLTNDLNFLNTSTASTLFKPLSYTPSWAEIISKPDFSIYYLASNPSGYISEVTSSMINSALGYTPVSLTGSYVNPSWITSLDWSKISSKPSLFSGDYNDLTNKPILFDGTYASLTGKPTIPTNTNQLTNGAGFLTSVNSSQITSALGFTPYNGTTNPNGYISSETDPTVPNYAKSLTGFSVIKSSTDPLYKAISYVPDWSEITSKPTLFSGNYNDLTNRPTIPAAQVNSDWNATSGVTQILNKPVIPTNTNQLTNGAGFITGVSSAQIASALGYTPYNGTTNLNGYLTSAPVTSVFGRTGVVTAQAGDYTTTQVTEGTNQYFTAARARTSISAGTGLSYDAATGVITNTQGSINSPTIATPTRALNTNFTISTTKTAFVSYSVSLVATNPLLVGASTSQMFLEYSTNGGTSWNMVSQASNSSAVGLSVSIQLTNTQQSVLTGVIPPNALVRLRTVNSGTASSSFISAQESTF